MNSSANGLNYFTLAGKNRSYGWSSTRIDTRPFARARNEPASELYRSAAEALAKLCGTEMAGISILDSSGMHYHIMFGHPVDAGMARRLSSAAFSTLIAADASNSGKPIVLGLGDAADNGFYAGMALPDAEGPQLAVLFIAGTAPDQMSAAQSDTLRHMGQHVAALFAAETVRANVTSLRLLPAESRGLEADAVLER